MMMRIIAVAALIASFAAGEAGAAEFAYSTKWLRLHDHQVDA